MTANQNEGISMSPTFFEGWDPHNPWVQSHPNKLEEINSSNENNSEEAE